MKNNKNNSFLSKGVVMGITAAGAALLVFLYGTKKGKEERKKIKDWVSTLKDEIIQKLESLKDINKEVYDKVVDEVSEKFNQIKDLSQAEIEVVKKTLKGGWEDMKKEANLGGAKKVKSSKKK
ncbi:MAG: YtxH domain-containing protein [Patescibacteria group bacterium]